MSPQGRPVARSLEGVDTPALSDALDRLGLPGVLGGFQRWGPARPVIGRVRTVQLEVGRAEEPHSHLGARVLDSARPGDVIVVANGGRLEAAAWGGLLTLAARHRAVAGVLVDGAVRDVDQIGGLGIPVLGRTATCRTARGRYHQTGSDIPVTIQGVEVTPDAWLVADGSGAVIVAHDLVAHVVEIARTVMDDEARMSDALSGGEPVTRVMSARYERMLEGHL